MLNQISKLGLRLKHPPRPTGTPPQEGNTTLPLALCALLIPEECFEGVTKTKLWESLRWLWESLGYKKLREKRGAFVVKTAAEKMAALRASARHDGAGFGLGFLVSSLRFASPVRLTPRARLLTQT